VTYHYLSACMGDPGTVPSDYQPKEFDLSAPPTNQAHHQQQSQPSLHGESSVSSPRSSSSSSNSNVNGNNHVHAKHSSTNKDKRWCGICSVWKAPRAHHCSECDKCVLRMDHHCVWINNCVGYYNHKHFYLFLVNLLMTSIHHLLSYAYRTYFLFSELRKKKIDNSELAERSALAVQILVMALMFIITIPTLLGVGALFSYQTGLIASNMTCIEDLQTESERRRLGRAYRNVYDRGLIQNFRDILGSRMFCWYFPTRMEGDGLHFKTIKNAALEA